jgi:hypothetical protein
LSRPATHTAQAAIQTVDFDVRHRFLTEIPMPIRARPLLLLDLDGTLVDPARGMLGCYRHVLAEFGVFPADAEDLRWLIGPPRAMAGSW